MLCGGVESCDVLDLSIRGRRGRSGSSPALSSATPPAFPITFTLPLSTWTFISMELGVVVSANGSWVIGEGGKDGVSRCKYLRALES